MIRIGVKKRRSSETIGKPLMLAAVAALLLLANAADTALQSCRRQLCFFARELWNGVGYEERAVYTVYAVITRNRPRPY